MIKDIKDYLQEEVVHKMMELTSEMSSVSGKVEILQAANVRLATQFETVKKLAFSTAEAKGANKKKVSFLLRIIVVEIGWGCFNL